MPSDTYFSQSPEWGWLAVLYLFFGGIAGGSFAIAALVDLFGDEVDRPLARLGYIAAFPVFLLCAPLLVLDLKRPERFWHLLIKSETGTPIFKYWSPMSAGSWALLVFGIFAFLAFVGALAEAGVLPMPWLARLLRRGPLRWVIALLGGLAAFFLASYTGVLLTVTNRPIWADTRLLGLLFLTSAFSTAAALLLLLARRRGAAAPASVSWLERLDVWVMLLELVALALVVISLGSVAQDWLNEWGVTLLVGVVIAGILVPLLFNLRPRLLGRRSVPVAAVLVLAGGLILRAVVVFSAQSL
jgi:formate-dependent nitrite reductase membrane component NrfD